MNKPLVKGLAAGVGISAAVLFGIVGGIAALLYLAAQSFPESAAQPTDASNPPALAASQVPDVQPSPTPAAEVIPPDLDAQKRIAAEFEEYAQRAVALYPDAGREGTPMFNLMAQIHATMEATGDPVVNHPQKAFMIAERAAAALGISPVSQPTTAQPPSSTDTSQTSESLPTRDQSLANAKILYPDLNDPTSEFFGRCQEVARMHPGVAASSIGPTEIAKFVAKEMDAEERAERKAIRRQARQPSQPMSPTDPRRLVAAGSTEFATGARSEQDATPPSRRRQTTAAQALELRQTGNYFTDQDGNMHRITTLSGEGNFMIGDDLEVRGNNAFDADGHAYRVRRDSTGRVFIEP
jgi:hypothetical protein